MATNPIITHQKTALPHETQVKNLIGVSVSTAVTVTAKSTVAVPFLVTTKPVSGSHIVMTKAYSYDGVILTESFISDI